MPATIDSSAPTAAHRADFDAAFRPSQVHTGSAALAWPAAAGVFQVMNSAGAAAFTLPNDSGIPVGTPIGGMNVGVGALSFAIAGGGTIQMDPILPSTVSQNSEFLIRRGPGNTWVRVA